MLGFNHLDGNKMMESSTLTIWIWCHHGWLPTFLQCQMLPLVLPLCLICTFTSFKAHYHHLLGPWIWDHCMYGLHILCGSNVSRMNFSFQCALELQWHLIRLLASLNVRSIVVFLKLQSKFFFNLNPKLELRTIEPRKKPKKI